MMEDSNHQDNNNNDIDMNNDNEEDSDVIIEEVDSDDEYDLFSSDTFKRLKQNDPSLTAISVDYFRDHEYTEGYFKSINWKENVCCISNNTHLKELRIHYQHSTHYGFAEEEDTELPTKEQLQYFFSSIHENRSIEIFKVTSVSIDDEFGGWLIKGLSGHQSLKKLQIGQYIETAKLGSIVCNALGQVLEHPESKLKILHLRNCILDDDGFKVLSDGLLGNGIMKRLYLSDNQHITSIGWRALSNVLRHPNCKLVHLDLFSTGLTDDIADILGSALIGSSLKTLILTSNNSISSRGWQTLFNQLSQTSVKHLALNDNKIDDAGLVALASISTLKSLDLHRNKSITPTGWQSFFDSLQTRGTQLVKLNGSYNRIGIEGIFALASLLSNMSSLKTLELSNIIQNDNDSDRITSQGWVTFFVALQDSNLDLVKLVLNNNSIDNEGLQLLVRILSNMNLLKCLNLPRNHSVTPTGWQALTGYLQSPNFALEYLTLDGNNMNDETVIAFASALVNNKTLKQLSLYHCHDGENFNDDWDETGLITDRAWEAISSLLCNKTSIMSTYNSNHSLHEVSIYDYTPDETELYTDLNYNIDKTEVARQKILQTHFSDDTTSKLQELLDMELEMLPTAIAWMGRPIHDDWLGTNVSGLSTMYNLLRRLPDLFDSMAQNQAKRRKGN